VGHWTIVGGAGLIPPGYTRVCQSQQKNRHPDDMLFEVYLASVMCYVIMASRSFCPKPSSATNTVIAVMCAGLHSARARTLPTYNRVCDFGSVPSKIGFVSGAKWDVRDSPQFHRTRRSAIQSSCHPKSGQYHHQLSTNGTRRADGRLRLMVLT